jgi:hypothetical protein
MGLRFFIEILKNSERTHKHESSFQHKGWMDGWKEGRKEGRKEGCIHFHAPLFHTVGRQQFAVIGGSQKDLE